jgi:dihydropteroate synthase
MNDSRPGAARAGKTLVMGVLNVTPDSFYAPSRVEGSPSALLRAQQMVADGADILDVGGESTRPGNQSVSEEEETRRVIPVIEALSPVLRIPISVDTYRAEVAKLAIDAGAQIVNDISGLRFEPGLAELIQSTRAGLVLMHSRGTRGDLHRQPATDDPVRTVVEGLNASLETARAAGIAPNAIVIDPGIGFSKDAKASFKILKNLNVFSKLPYPLLVGTSRKSFIRSRAIIQDSPEAILMGTAASVAIAIIGGAHIVRVHDIREMRVVAGLTDRVLMA